MFELSLSAQAHLANPRHVGCLESSDANVVEACVGEPVSGYILQLQFQTNAAGVIVAARFKAYGCGWLIACGSLLAERLIGQSLTELRHFRHHQLVEALELPPEKLYCAVLAETALQSALHNLHGGLLKSINQI
jgi:NifU-like protein involved in Fe-S cluster formation